MDVEKYTGSIRASSSSWERRNSTAIEPFDGFVIPWQIAQRACEEVKVMLAPILYYGFSHWAWDYPGTMSISTIPRPVVIQDLIARVAFGFRNFHFLNGHSGIVGAVKAQLRRHGLP